MSAAMMPFAASVPENAPLVTHDEAAVTPAAEQQASATPGGPGTTHEDGEEVGACHCAAPSHPGQGRQYATFREFLPFYASQHQEPGTRRVAGLGRLGLHPRGWQRGTASGMRAAKPTWQDACSLPASLPWLGCRRASCPCPNCPIPTLHTLSPRTPHPCLRPVTLDWPRVARARA